MKIFLDTADIESIKRANDTGLVDGITTNPSKILESGKKFQEVLKEICKIVKGPVSAEAVAVKAEDIVKEAVDPRVKFLVRLGRALHEYGVPAHRLEDTLSNASACLGVKGEFFSGPTSLISSFGEAGQQHTALSRVQPNELQIDKLVVLDEAVEALYRAELTIEQASE